LSQEGQGTISPTMGSTIKAGVTYTLTAKPGVGQEFAGWTGSINSDSPIIKFVANSNIVLHAKFVPSPYILGTYNGLFNEGGGVNQNSSGSFSVTVSAHGIYSGKLQLGASKLSFKGKFNLQCIASNSIPRSMAAPLTLQMRLGTNSEADQIFGQLIDNSWTAAMTGDRARFNSLTNPCPFTGSYTMIIPGQAGDASKPAGHGYGTVKVATSGLTVLAGVLADGTKVTQSKPLSKNGVWPVYASLYLGQGSVLSWMTFANHASDDLSGALSWIKLPVMTSRYYPGGFTTAVMASGSKFVKPVLTTDLIINMPSGVVDFSGGNLSSDFSNNISLGLSSKVTNLSSNKLTMAFSTSTGLYKGTVVDPTSGATLPFAGAVFQKNELGYGSLMGANQSSSVVVGP
jgi:Divergent InlB B-repeat domain